MKFTIPYTHGYYAQAGRNKWQMSEDQRKRVEKYREYHELIRVCAKMAGIVLPLKATKEKPLMINTVTYFENGKHCDPGNVQKAVCDALFYGGSGDKYTGAYFPPPRYDAKNPRVEVEILEYRE